MELALAAIAQMVGGEVIGDPQKTVVGAAAFETAAPDEIALAGAPRYLKQIDATRAGALMVPLKFEAAGRNLVRVGNPAAAFARVLSVFHPLPRPAAGISPGAVIGGGFSVGLDPAIAPLVFIGENVTFGDRVAVYPGVFIGDEVFLGDDTTIFPNVTIMRRCRIGQRVIVNPGTVIGADGFGFAPEGERYRKIPHTGSVQIDDDCEIGALNTIDRATFGKTWIKQGVKTDNLVQIAHNVTIGENSVVVAQVGISGSTVIGRHAVLAGQAGIAGHLTLGDNVTVGPQAGVGKSIPSGEVVSSGLPAMAHRTWLRVVREVPRLPELARRLTDLEKRLKTLEEEK